jgi:hypothetical protein
MNQSVQAVIDRSTDDIVDVLANYIDLKRSGTGYKACCPFHDEKTPSLSISEQKGIWKCFGCGDGGSAIDFVMKMEGLEFMEAVKKLADQFHITIHKSNKPAEKPSGNRDALVPGLFDQKSEIRKQKKVFVHLSLHKVIQPERPEPAHLYWQAPIIELQAKSLSKYTDHTVLLLDNIPISTLHKSINSLLSESIHVFVLKEGKELSWHDYIMSFELDSPEIRKLIVESISKIPDRILRSIFSTDFTNKFESLTLKNQ